MILNIHVIAMFVGAGAVALQLQMGHWWTAAAMSVQPMASAWALFRTSIK